MTDSQLKTHLKNIDDLLAIDAPTFTPPDDGFLEIIGLSHYENTNSKIYAYFLNQKNEPKISNLFISSLLNLIDEKNKSEIGKELNIEEYSATTEIQTNEGRIDILIEDKTNESAIIIENKIYHNLDNPLNDYWNFINYSENKKVGILLTLQLLSSSELKMIRTVKKSTLIDNFINITHKEWIDKIIATGLPTGLSPKMYIYLNDFFQTIDNLTKSITMNELTKFYFKYPKKINSAVLTLKEAEAFIDTQLQILAEKLKLTLHGKTFQWRNILNENDYNNICYTVYFEPLFKGENKVSIIITLEGDKLEQRLKIQDYLTKKNLLHDKKLNTNKGSNFCHFITKEYELNINEIENLAETLFNKIDTDFKDIMVEIDNFSNQNPTLV